jgi:Carboxypeptidase regulatory-like domain
MKNSLTHFALGLTLMFGVTAGVLAQSTSGVIQGTVLDPSGALVPRAQVTITNSTGFSRTLKSGATGGFEVQHLAPGIYSIGINAPGFTPALEGVHVTSDKVSHENIKLGMSVEQEIVVYADESGTTDPQGDTADSAAGNR